MGCGEEPKHSVLSESNLMRKDIISKSVSLMTLYIYKDSITIC